LSQHQGLPIIFHYESCFFREKKKRKEKKKKKKAQTPDNKISGSFL